MWSPDRGRLSRPRHLRSDDADPRVCTRPPHTRGDVPLPAPSREVGSVGPVLMSFSVRADCGCSSPLLTQKVLGVDPSKCLLPSWPGDGLRERSGPRSIDALSGNTDAPRGGIGLKQPKLGQSKKDAGGNRPVHRPASRPPGQQAGGTDHPADAATGCVSLAPGEPRGHSAIPSDGTLRQVSEIPGYPDPDELMDWIARRAAALTRATGSS